MSVFEIFKDKPFGLGGVPFGNEFAYVTDEVAYATIEAAWNAGVRYYDTSPWYGLGLAERRLGSFLHKQTRSEYTFPRRSASYSRRRATTTRKSIFRSLRRRITSITITPATASSVRSKTAYSG